MRPEPYRALPSVAAHPSHQLKSPLGIGACNHHVSHRDILPRQGRDQYLMGHPDFEVWDAGRPTRDSPCVRIPRAGPRLTTRHKMRLNLRLLGLSIAPPLKGGIQGGPRRDRRNLGKGLFRGIKTSTPLT